ncbi:hypothetical protein E0Z10_g5577 [Xylaria hypoxylon]|uniref:Uncharacterized protein n=1 Tax=Xylaria hypoxylon TaxID=37992 RepID=A0A4Z0YGM6_9PEZI|nr:hypothetical protein E0Z10_g5577 [Xylaria hypoxylon]
MAESRWKSTLYPSDLFIEACGAIVFDTSTHPHKVTAELPREPIGGGAARGTRGIGLRHRPAAPHTAYARAVGARTGCVRDVPRVYDDVVEPFMLDVRDLGKGKGVKLVWWFVATLDGTAGEGESQFKTTFMRPDRAIERLTFQKDRDVLRRAVELMEHQSNGVATR